MRAWPLLVPGLVAAACASSAAPGAPCDAFARAATACSAATACDAALATRCAPLAGAVAAPVLANAAGCLESGACGATACLAAAPKTATRSLLQQQLAARYCNVCAPTVEGCIEAFYDDASKLPGPLVRPYSDAVVKAVHDGCITDGAPCRGSFVACATRTVTAAVEAALPADLASCVLAAFRDDPSALGPGGTPKVSRCTLASCAGCCRDDACQPGTESLACGAAGDACTSCSGAQACTGGACISACGPDNCAGCCDGPVCRTGTEHGTCGLAGAACRSCSDADACSHGRCVDANCPATCPGGCCDATGCRSGADATACGTAGEACVDCGAGRACSRSKACTLVASALWDVEIVSAVLPEKTVSGASWDADGLPDPYVVVDSGSAGRTHTGRTPTLTDTLTPVWSARPLTGISSVELTASLALSVFDEDSDADDYVGGCVVPLALDQFDGLVHTTTCPADGASAVAVTWRIRPH